MLKSPNRVTGEEEGKESKVLERELQKFMTEEEGGLYTQPIIRGGPEGERGIFKKRDSDSSMLISKRGRTVILVLTKIIIPPPVPEALSLRKIW